MTRLKPIGLSQEDREEPYEIIIPDRVQKLIDLYKKNHVEYPWTTDDKKNEQILNIVYTYCGCYPKEWILKSYCLRSTFLDYQPQK
jgi:hypothetical protein